MPFVRVYRIVINPMRCAERSPSIGAAREHHVRAVTAERAYAGYHVDVVIGRAARAVDSKKNLARQSAWIHCASKNQATAQVHCCDLVKRGRDGGVLRVARPNAPEAAS